MRLFYAILLAEEVKDALRTQIATLDQNAKQGNFVRQENLHITLAFLGETNQVQKALQVLDAVQAVCFLLQVRGLGRFQRPEGAIYWAGIEKNPALFALQKQLTEKLRNSGFVLESRPFRPHLTLGRKVILEPEFLQSDWEHALAPVQQKVAALYLMKSERINGQLLYTPIGQKQLKEG